MSATRAAFAGIGAAVLLLAVPSASASVARGQDGDAVPAAEAEALELLGQAAAAGRERVVAGRQQVDTWQGGVARTAVHAVRYVPGAGLRVQPAVQGAASPWPPLPTVDAGLLPLLARRYDLAVVRTDRCAGRASTVVEARRQEGGVAGRLWLDRATGLALRREVYDTAGRPVLTTSFTAVTVAGRAQAVPPVAAAGPDVREQASSASWPSPDELPGGFARVPAARPEHTGPGVQHLAWSDGLSTVSVFSQPGTVEAPGDRGFVAQDVDGSTVWVSHDGPERVVWNGAGQVFTLVSDAGSEDLLAIVRTLPRDPAPDTGLSARLARGLARIGSWLDPTD